ncbi:MAG: hypothetical protein WCI50_10855 [Actinomycetes bacterium]
MDETVDQTAAAAANEPDAPSGLPSLTDDVRARVATIARDVVADATDLGAQVADLVSVVAGRVRTDLRTAGQVGLDRATKARDLGVERAGDARGRVQPVVEQVQSQASRVVGAGLDRAKALVGRGESRAA